MSASGARSCKFGPSFIPGRGPTIESPMRQRPNVRGKRSWKGQKSEVVASGETDLEARKENFGDVFCLRGKTFRKWERVLWWKEKSGVPAVVFRELRRLTAESSVKYCN